MDGCDHDWRMPGPGRDTRAEDRAAVRCAVLMTGAGLAFLVAMVVAVAWLAPAGVGR